MNRSSLTVNTRKTPYQVQVGDGILSTAGQLLMPFDHGQKWAILTHRKIWDEHGLSLSAVFKKLTTKPEVIIIDEGEKSKSLRTAESVYSQMIKLGCDRSSWLIAFGGGVIGDLTGFIASTFMRGMSYIQIPTSLLAMVDSSIGGKTAVNIEEGKNLVGTFYPPRMVITDPRLLSSLPRAEIYSAAAEIIKSAVIGDAEFYQQLQSILEKYNLSQDPLIFSEAILNTCRIKSGIVSLDETESGLRRILNFGHTVGHALETVCGHGSIRHGEAVAGGMLCAGFISHIYGTECGLRSNLSRADWLDLQDLIKMLPLPDFQTNDSDHLIKIIRRDKKNQGEVRNFVLLEKPGKPVISNHVSDEIIQKSLEQL